MYCLGCRYNLKSLPHPRCPECGRDFDPANPDTFAHSLPHPAHPWFTAAIALTALHAPFIAVLVMANLRFPSLFEWWYCLIGPSIPLAMLSKNPSIPICIAFTVLLSAFVALIGYTAFRRQWPPILLFLPILFYSIAGSFFMGYFFFFFTIGPP